MPLLSTTVTPKPAAKVAPAPAPQAIAPFQAQCINVVDGDTVDVGAGQATYRVRLAYIDAPELAQPFGPEAREFLTRRCMGKPVLVTQRGRDKWGRLLAVIDVNGSDLSQAMVGSGMAWSYGQELAALELPTRARRLGLWTDGSAVPPWVYRKEAN